MSAFFRVLPVVAVVGVVVMNSGSLKKTLNIVGKVQVAATSSTELSGIASALANHFAETQDLPVESFDTFLRENLRAKNSRSARDQSKDPWGTGYRLNVDAARNGFAILSAGPDKNWKTDDDLNYFYDLTGVAGKSAISSTLAARARTQAVKEGASSPAAASAVAFQPNSVPSAAPRTQSAEETKRKVIEFQMRRAAEGSPQAQYDMGMRYLEGDGVERDPVKGRELLEKSAQGGHGDAVKKLQMFPVKPKPE